VKLSRKLTNDKHMSVLQGRPCTMVVCWNDLAKKELRVQSRTTMQRRSL